MTSATNVKKSLITSKKVCTRRIFWRRLLCCTTIEFVLPEEHVITKLSPSNENTSPTHLHTSYVCCVVELLLIFGVSSNYVVISPESLSTYVSKRDKNLSSSSLVPSVVNPYQRGNNSSFFRSFFLVTCFANAPVRIWVVFVRSHWYFFTVLESRDV